MVSLVAVVEAQVEDVADDAVGQPEAEDVGIEGVRRLEVRHDQHDVAEPHVAGDEALADQAASGRERARERRAPPGELVPDAERVVEPVDVRGLPLGDGRLVGVGHLDVVLAQVGDEVLEVTLVGHPPTDVGELILLAGVDREAVAHVVHP